jgi:sterol desaturase/sphingolipid hydroxylase (fatty acid hydroxylase superfamily)
VLYNKDMGMKEQLVRFRSFWLLPLLSAELLLATYRGGESTLFSLGVSLIAGLLAWTLLEYVFHRFILHATIRNPLLRSFVNESHLRHHLAPRDPDQILVKPLFALAVSAVIYAIILLISRNPFVSSGIMVGIWAGFLYYEAVHYRVHMSLTHSRLLQQQRRAHFYHHFSNSRQCFGVTSPLWDYVFGTMRKPDTGAAA